MTQPSDSPVELELALRAAREALGQPAEIARVRRGLDLRIAQGSMPLSAAGPGAAVWPKLVLLGALGAGGLLYATWPSAAPPQPAVTPRTAAVATASAPDPRASAAQPTVSAPAATSASTPAGTSASTPTAPSASTPAASPAAAQSRERPTPRAAGATATPTPTATASTPAATSASAPAASSAAAQNLVARTTEENRVAPVPTPTRHDPELELSLISRAQKELRTRPAQALALLSEHAARYPSGLLAQERDALRIDAERALGHVPEAREHARRFIADYPRSPQARALSRWLAQPMAAVHKSEPEDRPTP